jgi:hypothetical protein
MKASNNRSSPVAQSVEQMAVNHRVRGSSPRWGAKNNEGLTIRRLTPLALNDYLCRYIADFLLINNRMLAYPREYHFHCRKKNILGTLTPNEPKKASHRTFKVPFLLSATANFILCKIIEIAVL